MRARLAGLLLLLLLAPSLRAQDARDAQRRLQGARSELHDARSQRRQLQGQRGDADRRLRAADERVGVTQTALEQTRSALANDAEQLARLQAERARFTGDLAARRGELARLLRAVQASGEAAPLKALLAQDRMRDAERALVLQGYLQRAQAQRIRALSAEIARIQTLEDAIARRREALAQAQREQAAQVAQAQAARKERAGVLAEIDRQYRSSAAREKALGRDVRALQSLLARLRAEAARAAREARAREQAAANAGTVAAPRTRSTAPQRQVASAAPLRVGGLGWPVSGSLLASYGGRMPDGRRSDGVLIGAPAGTRVQAVADGTVVFADWMTGYGMILIIDHGNGYMSLYAHNDGLLHAAGDVVRRGDAVATVGSSGGQSMPALYFELRRDGKPVNPSTWLQRR